MLVALNREPLELNSKHIHQDVTNHEYRHGKSQHREYHREPVYKGARFPGGQHTKRNRNTDRDDNGEQRQHQRWFNPLADEFRDGQVGKNRYAEVALSDTFHPGIELDRYRFIQPEFFTDSFDVGRAGVVAGDDCRGVTGRQVQQPEHKYSDHHHHRDGCQNSFYDVSIHKPSFIQTVVHQSSCRTLPTRRIPKIQYGNDVPALAPGPAANISVAGRLGNQ